MCYDEVMQKGFAPVIVLVGVLVLVAVSAGAYYLGKSQTLKSQNQNQIVSQTTQPTSASSILTTSPVPTITTIPTPAVSRKTYTTPANWKKWDHSDCHLSFYLPPDWVVKTGCNIYYRRDAAFEPFRSYVSREAYKGKSRREQYIARFNDYGQCEPQLTNNTSVTESVINGVSVLKIVPKNIDLACQVTPALVFVKDNWLYSWSISKLVKEEGGRSDYWNDEKFMDTFYKIIASIQ